MSNHPVRHGHICIFIRDGVIIGAETSNGEHVSIDVVETTTSRATTPRSSEWTDSSKKWSSTPPDTRFDPRNPLPRHPQSGSGPWFRPPAKGRLGPVQGQRFLTERRSAAATAPWRLRNAKELLVYLGAAYLPNLTPRFCSTASAI